MRHRARAVEPGRRGRARAVALVAAAAAVAAALVPGAGVARAADVTNGLIAFVTDRDGNLEVYTTDPAGFGTGTTNLTQHPGNDYAPAWSPDGSRIAFTSTRSGNPDVWVMDADGSNPVQLTTSTADDAYPTWSPDGLRIAFGSRRTGFGDVYTMAADGTDVTRLTYGNAQETSPRYSPDGTTIVYERTNYLEPTEVWMMLPTGLRQVQLAFDDANNDVSEPAISPDGTQVLVARGGGVTDLEAARVPNGRSINVLRADGTREGRLVNLDFYNGDPAWSPDGQAIAFRGSEPDRARSDHIYIATNVGTNIITITGETGPGTYNGQPAWQPVGAPPFVAPPAVLERLLIGSNSQNIMQMTVPLVGGEGYRVTVRGEYHWFYEIERAGVTFHPDSLADAECSATMSLREVSNQFVALDPQHDDLDLYINETAVAWTPRVDDGFGCNSDDNVYSYDIPSAAPGARLRFRVRDRPQAYTDNVGVLTVEVNPLP